MTDAHEAGTVAGVLGHLEGEIGRRLVHLSGAGLPILYLLGTPWWALQGTLVGGIGIVAALEYVRLRRGLDWWIFEHLTRPYEQEAVAGYALYVVSVAVVAVAFEPGVAVPAMLMLAVADPVGGVLAGEDPIPVKPLRAFVGAFLVCLLVGLPFLPPAAAVAAATGASLADGVFLRIRGTVIDDNLSIPIVAAVAAWLVVTYAPVG